MKTRIDNIDENIYNIKTETRYIKKGVGISEDVIRLISKEKDEPDWVLDIRLKALKLFNEINNPDWGPELTELDINKIATYIKPETKKQMTWDDVPDDIRNVFDKLGIPEAEKESLAGVGAQYDSEAVYHNLSEKVEKLGVIYTDFDTAIKEYPELVKKYFSKAVPLNDHQYIELHSALFSGGSFIYVPKGFKLYYPLQSYFRLNAPGAVQF